MEPHHARVHLKHDLDRAASVARALRETDIRFTREIVLDALSVTTPERSFSYIISEKCDVLATSTIPKRIKAIRELIALAREMQASI